MVLRDRRVAVTGGAGFIGSHVAEALARDNDVVVLDDFSSGKPENLLGSAGVRIVRGSVTEAQELKLALKDADLVFHLAARPSVPASVRDPAGTGEVNLTGTLKVLTAALDAGVEKVVFSSSCAVYGDLEPPIGEDALPLPKSPYAAQKLGAEHYCRVFHQSFGLRTVCLRYFNVYGPRQDPRSQYAAVVPAFFRDLREKGRLKLFGDGRQTRDFIFVDDVVRANLLAAEKRGADGLAVNIATGVPTSILELARLTARILGKPLRAGKLPRREGDIRHSFADITLAKKNLGFKFRIPLSEGLASFKAFHVP